MFVNKNKHYLSTALMQTAILNIATELADGIFRKVMSSKVSVFLPMTGNDIIWYGQMTLSFIQIILTIVIFARTYLLLIKKRGLVQKDDFTEMAKLQEEYNPDNISTLSLYSIYQLFQIWAVILVGVRIVYEVSAIAYRKMVAEITLLLSDANNLAISANLLNMYNNSHGFKYIGMFVAVVIGIAVTGIFLKDRMLGLTAFILTALFMLTFSLFNLGSLNINGLGIGIVWTSVIFHILETVGIMVMSIYLSKKYRGL